MAAIDKKTIIFSLLIPVVAVLSFFGGRNYQELVSMYDQYALFMNLSGDHIHEINKTLGALESEDASTALYRFNQRVIDDFGCSPWIHHVADMKSQNIDAFKSAVKSAFDNSGGRENVNGECLDNLREYSILKQ